MTDDDHGEEQDPLLVRPFLLHDTDAAADDQSTQTWPSATTREVRSQRALEGVNEPTAVLPVITSRRRRRGRHRLLVLIAACAAVLLGAAAAGFAAMRSGGRPSVSAALPDAPIPTLSGLVPASRAARPSVAAPTAPTSHKPTPRRKSSGPTAATSANARSPATGKSAASAGGRDGSSSAAMAPQPPAAPRTGTIRGQNGLCLDLNGGVTTDFNHVQVADCNGTSAQRWTLATDGTLRVLGKCALIVGDDTVHIITCDTRATAQWRASGQLLINSANSECLTDPSAGTRSGTAVKVATCSSSASQRWSLP